jgi:hypothetical protein
VIIETRAGTIRATWLGKANGKRWTLTDSRRLVVDMDRERRELRWGE